MQVGVPLLHSGSTNLLRLLRRGGGFDSYYYATFSNCSSFCALRMQPQSMWTSTPPSGFGDDPQFLRCFDVEKQTPLNGIRFAFVSQLGTTELDPDLPRMNATDFKGCLGMIKFEVVIYYNQNFYALSHLIIENNQQIEIMLLSSSFRSLSRTNSDFEFEVPDLSRRCSTLHKWGGCNLESCLHSGIYLE